MKDSTWTLEVSQPPSPEALKASQGAYSKVLADVSLGFKDPKKIGDALEQCQSHRNFIDSCKTLIVIGLGGSSLGTKALAEALYPNEYQNKIVFLDNVDTHTVDSFLHSIKNPSDYGWILCSKSGSTIEVLSLYEYCSQAVKELYDFSIQDKSVVITEAKLNPLSRFAQERGLPQLEMPADVGGRFSAFTAIGLFPMQIFSFDGEKAQSGFKAGLESQDLICRLSAMIYESFQDQIFNFYSFQYCDRLRQWSFWLQQLWSESLSKRYDRLGNQAPVVSTFIPCRGASGQHSVLQQIIEGHEKKQVCFHRVLSSEKSQFSITQTPFDNSLMINKGIGDLLGVELEATEQAIRDSGRSTLVLTTEELNEASMAFIMAVWMSTIGVLGEMLGINAFDQPGVESGKVIARRVLGQAD